MQTFHLPVEIVFTRSRSTDDRSMAVTYSQSLVSIDNTKRGIKINRTKIIATQLRDVIDNVKNTFAYAEYSVKLNLWKKIII